MPDHTVEQGDCLTSIGRRYRLAWKTIWDHPDNAGLKSKRGDPNVLFAGDVLHIPEPRKREESVATEKLHRFKLTGEVARLQIQILHNGRPRASEPYELTIDEVVRKGKTDDEGWIREPIPADAGKAELVLTARRERYRLNLGHLDPRTEIAGVQARLLNLGLYGGPIDGELNALTRGALRVFQKKHGLSVTGEPDDPTLDSLVSEHGS